jgi:hypothetical protein
MAQNFIGCDREQVLLMPPSMQDWLPQNHLAWFVLDAVEEMDLRAFYAAYRGDGVAVRRTTRRSWLRCCCMRIRVGSARRGVSSRLAWRTSRTG